MELCPADGQAEQCHPHPGYVAGSPKFNFPTTVPSNRIQYLLWIYSWFHCFKQCEQSHLFKQCEQSHFFNIGAVYIYEHYDILPKRWKTVQFSLPESVFYKIDFINSVAKFLTKRSCNVINPKIHFLGGQKSCITWHTLKQNSLEIQ